MRLYQLWIIDMNTAATTYTHKKTTGCAGKYINTLVIAESNIPPSYDRPRGQKK